MPLQNLITTSPFWNIQITSSVAIPNRSIVSKTPRYWRREQMIHTDTNVSRSYYTHFYAHTGANIRSYSGSYIIWSHVWTCNHSSNMIVHVAIHDLIPHICDKTCPHTSSIAPVSVLALSSRSASCFLFFVGDICRYHQNNQNNWFLSFECIIN